MKTDCTLDRLDLRILTELQNARPHYQCGTGRCGRTLGEPVPDARQTAREGRVHCGLRRAVRDREAR